MAPTMPTIPVVMTSEEIIRLLSDLIEEIDIRMEQEKELAVALEGMTKTDPEYKRMRNEVLRLRTEADARLFQCNALAEEAEKRERNGEPKVECEDEDIQRLLRVAKWKRNMVDFPGPDARVEDTGETLSSKVYEGA